jgi:putative ABC transport system permease protein
MNLLVICLANLRHQPLVHLLHLALMALGTALIAALLLISTQLQERLTRDAQGIDLVIGAKGSPLQLILSSVYHLDTPTGNIPWTEAARWAAHPQVERTVPIALGDSLRGYRIVGTTPEFLSFYGADLAHGGLWQRPMQAVVGAEVAAGGLAVGAGFAGVHGLDGGLSHAEHRYTVSGQLAPTGTVLDRLILTSLESVWQLHGEDHDDDDHAHEAQAAHEAHAEQPDGREITALLLRYRSPLAAAFLPQGINAGEGRLQAAAPAQEMLRLFELLGLGTQVLQLLGGMLVLIAGLSIFAALYSAMESRQYDLAVLSTLGASRGRIIGLLWLEALLLAFGGTLLGLLLAHAGVGLAGQLLPGMPFTGARWVAAEWGLLGLAFGVASLSALLPAARAYRSDVAAILSRGG